MFTEQYCDDYYMSLIKLQPIYVWGANMERADFFLIQKLHKTYGNAQRYNATYYENKFIEAQKGSGWISDCSGMIYPISKKDNNAKGYYANCPQRGPINSIDLDHSCLVFRGSNPQNITHVGYYCASNGEVMEMASSKANFQHKKFNKMNWNYWGKPDFIKYSDVPKKYLKKGIDVSAYQDKINYSECKKAGVECAILKIIRKDLNKDKLFEKHWQGFTDAGIPIAAVYNYSYAMTADKARSDAQKVIEYLNGRKVPICLDIEDDCQHGLGSTIVDIINTYQQVVETAGLPFILYTGRSFYNSYIKPYETKLKCSNKWIARYYKGYNVMEFCEDPNEEFKPMNNIMGWQYTSSGHIPNCPGTYDFNILYSDAKIESSSSPSIEIAQVKTKGSSLNVRNKPISGKVVRKLSNGSIISIYGTDAVTGWYKISNSTNEWVCPDYVQRK